MRCAVVYTPENKKKNPVTLWLNCVISFLSFSYIDAQVVSVSFSFMAQVSWYTRGEGSFVLFFLFEEEEKKRWRTTKGNDMDVLNFLRASLWHRRKLLVNYFAIARNNSTHTSAIKQLYKNSNKRSRTRKKKIFFKRIATKVEFVLRKKVRFGCLGRKKIK